MRRCLGILSVLLVTLSLSAAAQGGKQPLPVRLALTVNEGVVFFDSTNDRAAFLQGIVKGVEDGKKFRVLAPDDSTAPAVLLTIAIDNAWTRGRSGTRWQGGFVASQLLADAEVTDVAMGRVLSKRRIDARSLAQNQAQLEKLYPNLIEHFVSQVKKLMKDAT